VRFPGEIQKFEQILVCIAPVIGKPTGPVLWDTLESSPRLDEEERQPQHRIDGEQLQAFVPGGFSALGDLVRDEDR
jgi:hypothetical protein